MTRALILAAGRGARLRPLTDTRPKALIEVAGQPLIVRHLKALRSAGVTEIVINLSHLGEQIRQRLSDGQAFGVNLHYSVEPDTALETGGGILQALPQLGPEPFWVINADLCTDYPLQTPALGAQDLAHVVMVANPAHHVDGDFVLHDGRLQPAGGPRLTFAGIGYYRPKLFAECSPGRFPLAPLLKAAIRAEHVSAERYDGRWIDVGTPERLAAACALFADNIPAA